MKMPSFMLRKVCIAQGFRLAFPDDLGSMPYIPEELPQTSDTTSEQLPKDTIDIQAENSPQTSQDAPQATLEDVPDFSSPEEEKPKTELSKERKALEAKLVESGIDRELFKRYLAALKNPWIKEIDGRLSMNTVPDEKVKGILENWLTVYAKFNSWLDKQKNNPSPSPAERMPGTYSKGNPG